MVLLNFYSKKALANEDIDVFGDGNQMRSFGFVGDAVDCTIALIDNEKSIGEVFNIGNEREISINDLANLVIKKCNSSSGSYIKLMKKLMDLVLKTCVEENQIAIAFKTLLV